MGVAEGAACFTSACCVCVQMSDLSLRDAVDGQPLEFQLTLHSQNKSFKLVVRDRALWL